MGFQSIWSFGGCSLFPPLFIPPQFGHLPIPSHQPDLHYHDYKSGRVKAKNCYFVKPHKTIFQNLTPCVKYCMHKLTDSHDYCSWYCCDGQAPRHNIISNILHWLGHVFNLYIVKMYSVPINYAVLFALLYAVLFL